MVWLGLEPGVAEWLAQTNPLSYGSTPTLFNLVAQLNRRNIDWLLLQWGSNTKFLNPQSYPSGCYGVVNARGSSLLPTGGLHHTVFQL